MLALIALKQLAGFDTVFRSALGTRNGSYLAVQLMLAGVFTLLAQRAWRRMDLAPLVRRPPVRPGDGER